MALWSFHNPYFGVSEIKRALKSRRLRCSHQHQLRVCVVPSVCDWVFVNPFHLTPLSQLTCLTICCSCSKIALSQNLPEVACRRAELDHLMHASCFFYYRGHVLDQTWLRTTELLFIWKLLLIFFFLLMLQ